MCGFAQWGNTSVGWFFGLKYHLIINQFGELMNFYVSAGNVSDNNAKVLFLLTRNLLGWLFGDKGYLLNQTKNACDAAHTRHRSPINAFANLFAALTAYSFRQRKPSTNIKLEARLLSAPPNQHNLVA